jgi:outer membrane beta-barrel protein
VLRFLITQQAALCGPRGGEGFMNRAIRHFVNAFLLALSALAGVTPPAWGAGEEGSGEEGSVYAIQRKSSVLKHEIHGAVGVLPMDAFYKGVAVGGGYTYHFSHHFAWEVAQFLTSFNIDTGLKDELQTAFAVEPTSFREVSFIANSNVVFTPLYGKMSLMNRTVVRMECYLTAGPGIARYTLYERAGASGYQEQDKYYFSANYGIGLRFFVSRQFAVRLDIRDYVNFVEDGVDHAAYFGLALGWNFRLPKFADQEEGE